MSSSYRHKTSEPYAEFIIRERGIAGYPALTVEVESTYNEQFVVDLKSALRHATERAWDPDLKKWFISPAVLERACKIAGEYYGRVYLVEGEKTTDIISGQAWEAPGLF